MAGQGLESYPAPTATPAGAPGRRPGFGRQPTPCWFIGGLNLFVKVRGTVCRARARLWPNPHLTSMVHLG
jgi:hypothetical protein